MTKIAKILIRILIHRGIIGITTTKIGIPTEDRIVEIDHLDQEETAEEITVEILITTVITLITTTAITTIISIEITTFEDEEIFNADEVEIITEDTKIR